MALHESPILWNESDLPHASTGLHFVSCRPDGNAWTRLAIIHGYGDHAGRYAHFMNWMAARGVACAAIDLQGHGRSASKRGYVARWDDYLGDVRVLLSSAEMRGESQAPLFVLGHSHGGLIAAAAAERGLFGAFDVRGVILCSPFLVSRLPRQRWNAVLARVLNLLAPAMSVRSGLQDEWMSRDSAILAETRQDPLYLRTATARWYLGQMRAQRQVMSRANEFRLPLLAISGSDDPIADPAGTQQFVSRAASLDKQFRLYHGQLHELLRESERQKTFEDVMTWMRQVTCGAPASGAPTSPPASR